MKNKKNIYIIIFVIFIIIVLIESIYIIYSQNVSLSSELNISYDNSIIENSKEEPQNDAFYIDIKGAVKKPGVYNVVKGTIISEAIAMAGGFKSNAYTSNINLSKQTIPELVIYVYTKSEYNNIKITSSKNLSVCESSSFYDITKCVTEGNSLISTSSSSEKSTNSSDTMSNYEEDNKVLNGKININLASKDDLMSLPGIGDSRAQSIITYRENNGGFKSIEEIMNISGIGQSMYDKIKDIITV